jgi:hypothetical protein
MRDSYRVLQVPTKWGKGAFTPIRAWGGAPATNGQNIIEGHPGTTPVPVTSLIALDDSSLGGPYNQPSKVAPNYIYPSIYTYHVNNTQHFPGRIGGDNVVPVPAISQGRSAIQSQHRVRVGGRTTTAAIRPFTQWPTYSRGQN